ncbi:hypothetical protein F5Y00DRAFT_235340 [Daldinia vernicosa]|uniref:uncharacterized protein n=1 Tax=Daldinia vernicosa TaxID=114800 RepID=UPI002008E4C0|nr:uncharacterized protein F5Y00DRAFT_235340 [Daldinia vernicosa]KAI0849632.1 hypothetical protein F5Y00DRAFT_235340 [Daldinia vernicosa]
MASESNRMHIRARWTANLTAVYMEKLAALTNEGLFAMDRPQTWAPAWPRLVEVMQKADPTRPWSCELMKCKRKLERKRYLQYQALINDYTSGDGEDDNGCRVVSDQQWASFLREHPTGKWLRVKPLGNKEIYAQAFPSDKSTDSFIVEAGEEYTLLVRHAKGKDSDDHIDTIGPESRSIGASLGDDSHPFSSQASTTSFDSSPTPSLTPRSSQKRKRTYDPDLISSISDDSDEEASPLLRKRAVESYLLRKALTNRQANNKKPKPLDLEGFEKAFIQGSYQMGRSQGADDVEKAVKYFDKNLASDIPSNQFVIALDVLEQGRRAVVFNALDSKEDKLRYLKGLLEKAA